MLSIRWFKNDAGRLVATWIDRGHDNPVIPLGPPRSFFPAPPGYGVHSAAYLDLRKVA
jgi:hypothetical protein